MWSWSCWKDSIFVDLPEESSTRIASDSSKVKSSRGCGSTNRALSCSPSCFHHFDLVPASTIVLFWSLLQSGSKLMLWPSKPVSLIKIHLLDWTAFWPLSKALSRTCKTSDRCQTLEEGKYWITDLILLCSSQWFSSSHENLSWRGWPL